MKRLIWILAAALVLGQTHAAPRPNLLLIMADDMGWSDIGCYGGEIATPNIDRLASEGVLWTNFYNNGKCTTTRASLLTGLYPRKGGRGIELLQSDMWTLGEALGAAGYQTGLSGKWHNGSKAPHRPFDRGFKNSYGLWDGGSNFFDPTQPDPKFKGGRVRFFGEADRRITEFPEDFYTTDAFTDHAIETISAHVATGEPFIHYLPYTAPHYPLHAKPEDIEKYEGRYEAGWMALRDARYERQVSMGLIDPETWPRPGPNSNNQTWEKGLEISPDWQQARMEVYAAMVDSMDQNIGRVLTALETLGVADNTLIIFLSDNGACAETPGGNDIDKYPGPKDFYSHVGPDWAYAQNTPFRSYKSNAYEGGIATPCVMRWPAGIDAGTRQETVGHILDFMPTFLELAGGDYRDDLIPLEGRSLVPALTEGAAIERDAPLFHHWAGHASARDRDWKVVRPKGAKSWELYHLANDRTETTDLAAQHPERAAKLAAQWQAWAAKTGVQSK